MVLPELRGEEPTTFPPAEENARYVFERGAISQAQHDKSLHDLIEKMGMKAEVDSNDD